MRAFVIMMVIVMVVCFIAGCASVKPAGGRLLPDKTPIGGQMK